MAYEKVKKWLDENEKTETWLAAKLHISKELLSHYKTSRADNNDLFWPIEHVRKMSRITGVPIHEFYPGK